MYSAISSQLYPIALMAQQRCLRAPVGYRATRHRSPLTLACMASAPARSASWHAESCCDSHAMTGSMHCITVQVVCTLGPVSRDVETCSELLRAGMSVARFNFSHGTHQYHQVRALGKYWHANVCTSCMPGWMQIALQLAHARYVHRASTALRLGLAVALRCVHAARGWLDL